MPPDVFVSSQMQEDSRKERCWLVVSKRDQSRALHIWAPLDLARGLLCFCAQP